MTRALIISAAVDLRLISTFSRASPVKNFILKIQDGGRPIRLRHLNFPIPGFGIEYFVIPGSGRDYGIYRLRHFLRHRLKFCGETSQLLSVFLVKCKNTLDDRASYGITLYLL